MLHGGRPRAMRTPPPPSFSLLLLCALLAGCTLPGSAPTPAPPPGEAALAACIHEPHVERRPSEAWRAEKPRVRLDTAKGAIVVELEREAAPATVENFLNLTRAGFYDGTRFHRLVPGFILQGGDPLTKDTDPANDGLGGSQPIQDEFNPTLRHDEAGLLSMANSGPETGSSQFFLTLGPAKHLDDRHAVFGRVVEGRDVLDALAATPVDAASRPQEPLTLTEARVVEPATFDEEHALALHPVMAEKLTAGGHDATFALVVTNHGTVRDAPTLRAMAPEGWRCSVDERPVIAAGASRVVLLTLRPPTEAEGPARIELDAQSAWNEGPTARANVTVEVGALGRKVVDGDRVAVDYATLLRDGRLFGTDMASVAENPAQPRLETLGGFAGTDAGPLVFTLGPSCDANEPRDCVLPGFERLARHAFVGETVAGVLKPEEAWETGDPYENPIVQREVVLEMRILRLV